MMSPTCCGTIAYIAPEVLNPPYEARVADIWSLGVCLFEMVTFTKPFEDTGNHRKLLKMQMSRAWHYPSSLEGKLTEEVRDLIHRMLEPDVEQRLNAMQVLQHHWIMSGFGTRS
jgi:serine/threonine protein kinase